MTKVQPPNWTIVSNYVNETDSGYIYPEIFSNVAIATEKTMNIVLLTSYMWIHLVKQIQLAKNAMQILFIYYCEYKMNN